MASVGTGSSDSGLNLDRSIAGTGHQRFSICIEDKVALNLLFGPNRLMRGLRVPEK